MPDKTSYAPGEPTWCDLSSPDTDASAAFYGALLGWTATERRPEFGGYRRFQKDAKDVAGLGEIMAPEQQPAWTCYISVDDAQKYATIAAEHGGTVMGGPHEVGDLGVLTVIADPGGAIFGTWQPKQMTGAQVVFEEGAHTWTELSTRDQGVAQPFYRALFAWEPQTSPDYTEFQLAGTSVAGCMDMPETVPDFVPSFWMPYFGSADPAEQAQQAADLGAVVMVPSMDFPGGTFSVVRDPHGCAFGLLRMNETG